MHDDLTRRAEAYLSSPEAMTAADDLISDLLAALKAQQPSSAGQTAPQVTQGDNGGRGFTVTQVFGKEATLAGGGGGVVGSGGGATYLVEVQGGGKAQQPAPIDAEGLPPLPEPVGVLHRGEGGEWSFSTGGHLRSLYAQPIGEHKLHTVDQLRRAQREAVAAYVLKCQREARTAVETIRQGAKT